MNQTAFASTGGVGKGAQVMYEAGSRFPGADYLASVAERGVDVLYVITGRREGDALAPTGVDAPAIPQPVSPDTMRARAADSGGLPALVGGGLLVPADASVARPLVLPVVMAGGQQREYQVVPNLNVSARAGAEGSNPVDAADIAADVAGLIAMERQYMRRALGRDGGGFITVRVSGDSMEPALHDGDVIVVDTQRNRVDVDGIYVLQSGPDLLVKRVQRMLDDSLVLRSDNPSYPPQTVQPGAVHALRIMGRMVRLRIR